MNDFEKAIKLLGGRNRFDGAESCDQCSTSLLSKKYIEANFKIGVVVFETSVSKNLCLACADQLASVLRKRLNDAGYIR